MPSGRNSSRRCNASRPSSTWCWACANLGRQIGELVDRWQDGVGRAELEERLERIYGEETGGEIRRYSDGELAVFAHL